MVKIHGLVYIAVGLFISIFSYKVNYEKLVFFYYLGYFFIFIGIIKLIFALIKRKNKKQETQPKTPAAYKRCHKCGNAVKINDKFCGRCGARV